ncbi:MAG TPA: cupin domain-containing protein [Thermodesulfobacteriota bacterium]|nr:cupin domain-containing protein [Thermodesulfobacteriota bacterium]
MRIVRLKDLEWVPASHEDLQAAGVLKKVMLKKDDLIDGRLQMINWCKLRVGRGFQPHYHEDMEEMFILLKGSVRMRVREEEADLHPGELVVVPIFFVHEMINTGSEEAEYLAIGISQGKGGKTVVV